MAAGHDGDAPAPGLTVTLDLDVPLPRLVVAGELDVSTVAALVTGLARLEATGCREMEVDLLGVTFADCAGGRPLVEAALRVARRGGQLRATGSRPVVACVLAHLGGVPGAEAAGGQRAGGRPSRVSARRVST